MGDHASLSFTISQSLLRLMSIESVMPSNHPILCCPLLLLPSVFASIRVFSKNWLFASGGQSIGTSASASVLPMNIQGWYPLGLTGLISLLSKGLSRVFTSWATWEAHGSTYITLKHKTASTQKCSWAIKNTECWRIDAFKLWCWRRVLKVPWIARESIQSTLKEFSSGYSLVGLMLKLKLQYFGHLIWRTDSFEKTWC